MIAARLFAAALLAGAVALAWSILVALRAESLVTAGPRLAADPWGWVTIVDVYLGFLVFAGYLVARERSLGRTLPWLVGLAVLGNLASALYLAVALHRGGYTFRSLLERAGGERQSR